MIHFFFSPVPSKPIFFLLMANCMFIWFLFLSFSCVRILQTIARAQILLMTKQYVKPHPGVIANGRSEQ